MTVENSWVEGSPAYALDEQKGWLRVRVASVAGDKVNVKDGKRSFTVKARDLQLSSEKALKGIEDMIGLDILHEGAIQNNVEVRYGKKQIYTYVGTILVSINPYEQIPNLYTEETIRDFLQKGAKAPPHLYSVSDNVYSQMLTTGKDQSMLISGESGAGKTEATKHCLRYLTYKATENTAFDGSNLIKQCIVDVNPVLEAFGNAKTKRNNNSSRFGKLFQVQFDGKGAIVGGNLISYLLEKSRVVKANKGERGYHIFYQLCKGASKKQIEALSLEDYKEFEYLKKGDCFDVEDMNDVEEFEKVCAAMSKCGIQEETQSKMFSILAAILHLGNINFEEKEGGTGENDYGEVSQASTKSLNVAAILLGVSPKLLQESLSQRTMGGGRGSIYKIPLGCKNCMDSRDALCKEMYSMLFAWLIHVINITMASKNDPKNFIAVLDIFGFEVFEQNSFEQLCINYANEVLHQQFIHHYFKLEQEEYATEGLNVEILQIDQVDNKPVLQLMTAKPISVFALLEEQCQIARGSDEIFIDRFTECLTKMDAKSSCLASRVNRQPTIFEIKHFAGTVKYDAIGFIEKNKDPLHVDLQNLMNIAAKKNELLGNVLKFGTTNRKMNTTVIKTFQKQVNGLMELLDKTEPNYVRCIKPNERKAPQQFEGPLILSQMRYSGLLDSIRIRQAGYAVRRTFEDIIDLFGNSKLGRAGKAEGGKQGALSILQATKMSPDAYVFGKTKVFFKDVDNYAHLLNEMAAIEHNAAVRVQAKWRQAYEKKKFIHAMGCVMRLKNLLITKIHRQRFLKKKQAAIKMQKSFRGFKARKELAEAKKEQMNSKIKEYSKRWENAFLCLKKTRENLRRTGWAYKKGGRFGGRRNWHKRYFVLYEDCLSYYSDVDTGIKPLGFKGSALLLKVKDVACETRNSFFFRDKKMSREKSETYLMVMKMEDDTEMLVGADTPAELDEWKESLRIAIREQTLLQEAKESEDKMPKADIEEVEKMLREVEIRAK
ncbi:heavy chain of myosin [Chloropicon primus]|uniref:Heavy chain of myosin n=1 Tax=Chloropicon primus TaxID=1764295 RepID=A0A5B8MF60_9CHLO|nr:heavy chain of myosin [Chloropicon primus]UPQ97197.1 heavy chain of myosin [Chloropicon primus]|eukprot:QDZ17982.1 heavy chain of myosin [Chloropicon primus]